MAERICIRCGASSATTPFVKDKRAPDGLVSVCRECRRIKDRAAHAANREQRNAQRKVYYEANREVILAQQREDRRRNIEKYRAAGRARYRANPEKSHERYRRWVAANRERNRDTTRRYYLTNRDRLRDAIDLRRLQAAGFDAAWEPIKRRQVWHDHEGCCGICGAPVEFEAMDLDHIQPVSKGGSHTRDNVQPAHKSCNSGKRDREG